MDASTTTLKVKNPRISILDIAHKIFARTEIAFEMSGLTCDKAIMNSYSHVMLNDNKGQQAFCKIPKICMSAPIFLAGNSMLRSLSTLFNQNQNEKRPLAVGR